MLVLTIYQFLYKFGYISSMGVVRVVIILVALYIVAMLSGFHEVKEGYVGIYKRLGVLQPGLSNPGFHFRLPFVETFI